MQGNGRSEREHARVLSAISSVLFLPIYLVPSPPFFSLEGVFGSASDESGNIHISLVIAPFCLLVMALKGRKSLPRIPIDASARVLAGWLTLVAIAVCIFRYAGGFSSLLTLGQLLIPASFLFVGFRLGSLRKAEHVLDGLFFLLLAYQALFIIRNASDIQGGASHDIANAFPQFLTYYPGVLALGVIVAWSRWSRWRVPVVLYFASLLIVIPAIWSRLGLATICLSVLFCSCFGYIGHARRRRKDIQIGGLITVCFGIIFFAVAGYVALNGTIGTRLQEKSDPLQSGRWSLAREGLSKVLDSPLIGDGGQALYDRRNFGGGAGQGLRMFPSHSQLVDMGIRGGVPAIILATIFLLSLARASYSITRARDSRASLVMPGAFIVLLFASVSDLYFTQALTASAGWLLIGLGWGNFLSDPAHPFTDIRMRPVARSKSSHRRVEGTLRGNGVQQITSS